MSGSCCGGSSKSDSAKVEMSAALQAREAAAERPAASSRKSECCEDKPIKDEKRGCGC